MIILRIIRLALFLLQEATSFTCLCFQTTVLVRTFKTVTLKV